MKSALKTVHQSNEVCIQVDTEGKSNIVRHILA